MDEKRMEMEWDADCEEMGQSLGDQITRGRGGLMMERIRGEVWVERG